MEDERMSISRDDLEAKARQIVGTVEETKESAKQTSMIVGLAVAGVVAAAFLFGKRRGGRDKTLVEVYKV
jgi:orotate phosphoribosyltransferase